MRYLLCFVFPPLAVFLCGKPMQAALNLVFTLFFIIPGVVHALFVVSSTLADERQNRLVKEMKKINKSK